MQKKFVLISITVLVLLVIAGVIYYYKANITKLSQQPISSQTIPIANQTQLQDWKTYTSASKIFSFKYPSTWVEDTKNTNGTGEEVVISAPPSPQCAPPHACGGGLDGISVSVLNNPNSLSVQAFIKKDPYNMYNVSHFVKNPSTLGIPADWVIDRNAPGAGSGEEVLIPKDTKIIDISFGSMSRQLIDQILSTFKFTQ